MQQSNTLRRQLDENDTLYGISIETGTPELIEVCGNAGCDWIWIDFEHKNYSAKNSKYIEHIVRAAECSQTELIVRVPADPSTIRKVLDAGIRNIIVPRISTASEVERVIEAARFTIENQPGERGLSLGRTTNYGELFSDETYPDTEDDNVLVGVLIENKEAVENLESILDIPELGFVFPGPGDMSVSLGHPLEYSHPEVQSHIETVENKSIEKNIPLLGVVGSNFEDPSADKAEPYQLVAVGNEFVGLRSLLEPYVP